VPNIDPTLGSPTVLEGFDAAGAPMVPPRERPITLRHLLTHTAGSVHLDRTGADIRPPADAAAPPCQGGVAAGRWCRS